MSDFGTVWTFKPKGSRFAVELRLVRDHGYMYDGDDPDGETQEKLDSGEFVAFDSIVRVSLDGREIAYDTLGGSVYAADEVAEFYQAHRTSAPEYRNTLAQKAAGRCIGHYFPDMVREAIRQARDVIRDMPSVPYIRESAD